ncbi:MAG: rubrerythrin family protein [Bacteroidales bacterium]|nr:rubrerythrin family protein [Bacteroidales bacterium]MBD5377033.1 rubrerythrin family protein [Bacteroides sp.]
MAESKSIVGTETEKNLVIAYLSESAAYSRYVFYAQQATKESLFPVANVFQETADNELHHAKIYFKYLEGARVVEVPMSTNAGVIGTTADNLKIAMAEEQSEGVDFYVKASEKAREEGFDDIADHFAAIATIEKSHYARFERYLKHIENGTLWKRDKPVKWRCLVCGYIFEGTEPPKPCPACNHPYQHYIALEDLALE